MKLRNKKTGEIVKFETNIYADTEDRTYEFSSIAKLNEEWEDYEEKTAWFIDPQGGIQEWRDDDFDDWAKEKAIGNYFETEEEAKKAVEKLKTIKRLKDKGFRFVEGYLDNNDDFIIKAKLGHVGLIDQSDISILFGGKE